MSEGTTRSARIPKPLDGVDVPTPFATLDAVKAKRATNRWQQGTHSRMRIESSFGADSEQKHADATANLVIATGNRDRPYVSAFGARLPAEVAATGMQLAHEIQESGRPVTPACPMSWPRVAV